MKDAPFAGVAEPGPRPLLLSGAGGRWPAPARPQGPAINDYG